MAHVLNRTTLELRESVNSPDYSDPPWLRNPDLSPVAGVPPRYWKLTGDVLSEMTAPIAVKRIEAELNRAPLFEPPPVIQRELLPT